MMKGEAEERGYWEGKISTNNFQIDFKQEGGWKIEKDWE
jgi:hypothetical protein